MDRTVSSDSIKACVVAENRLARAFLLGILRKEPDFQPVTLDSLLASSWSWKTPKVFVIDRCGLSMPANECLRRLRRRYPNARFLVLDKEYDREEVTRLLLFGAHGFLEQGRSEEFLVRAVKFVAAGRLWVAPDVLEAYLKEVAATIGRPQKRGAAFTLRETQILEMVRSRMSNREIAGLLKISISTVKFHVTNILSKQQAGGRRDLLSPLPSEIWNKL
jgi:NarL family two-component system response regulator LiaR